MGGGLIIEQDLWGSKILSLWNPREYCCQVSQALRLETEPFRLSHLGTV